MTTPDIDHLLTFIPLAVQRRWLALADAGQPIPCGRAGTSRWCPEALGHGGPCGVDWAVVEGRAGDGEGAER